MAAEAATTRGGGAVLDRAWVVEVTREVTREVIREVTRGVTRGVPCASKPCPLGGTPLGDPPIRDPWGIYEWRS